VYGIVGVLMSFTPVEVSSSLLLSCTVGSMCIPPLVPVDVDVDAEADLGCTMTLFNFFKSMMRVPLVDQLEGL